MSSAPEAAPLFSPERVRNLPVATPATALWAQRETIAALGDRFRALSAAVGEPTDLNLYQWAEFAAFALEFRPDLILELGRRMGNSTSCFIEVANILGGSPKCRVVSLCLSTDWFERTVPRLREVVTPEWFEPAEIHVANLLDYDIEARLRKARRPLILWDAHGFNVAEWVLGRLLPQLMDKPHLVLMHDMSDTRFEVPSPEYGRVGIWKGTNASEPSFWIGNISSRVAQAISIVDFTTRNQVPLHSGVESLQKELAGDAAKVAGLKALLGELFSLQAHWYWFTLNEAPGPLYFPRYVRGVESGLPADVEYRPDEWWRELERSAGWRMLNRWRALRNRALPEGSRRRQAYDFILRPIRGQ